MRSDLYWPIGITLTIVLFVGFLVVFFIFSRTVPLNMVTKNYYQKSMAYQDHINRIKRTGELFADVGWHYNRAEQTVTLAFPNTPKFMPKSGSVNFYRPSDARLDFYVPLQPDGEWKQKLNVAQLQKGLWRVYIVWQVDSTDYYKEEMLIVD